MKSSLSQYFLLALLAATALLFGSCRSSKSQVAETQHGYGTLTSEAELAQSYATVVNSYSPQWKRVEMPMSVKAQGLPMSLSGQALLVRGESVTMSFRMLGMEVAAARIDSDSILFVDRYNSRYLLMPTSDLTRRFPITIDNIQDLLTGRAFIAGRASLPDSPPKNVVLAAETEDVGQAKWYMLPPQPENIPADYAFVFKGSDILASLVIKVATGALVNVRYDDAVAGTPFGVFAGEATVDFAKNEQSALSTFARIKWNVGKARWNDDARDIRVTVPRDCKRIDAASLLKVLGGASK